MVGDAALGDAVHIGVSVFLNSLSHREKFDVERIRHVGGSADDDAFAADEDWIARTRHGKILRVSLRVSSEAGG